MGVFVRSVGCAFALVRLLLTYSYLLLLHQIFCIAICCDSYCLSPVFSFIDRLTVGLLPCIGYPALVPGPIQHARATLQLPSPGMLKHRSRTISHCPRSVLCWWLYFTGFLLPLSRAAPSTTSGQSNQGGSIEGEGLSSWEDQVCCSSLGCFAHGQPVRFGSSPLGASHCPLHRLSWTGQPWEIKTQCTSLPKHPSGCASRHCIQVGGL